MRRGTRARSGCWAAMIAAALVMTACTESNGDDGSTSAGDDSGDKGSAVDTSPRAEDDELVLISRQDPGNWNIVENANAFLNRLIPGNVLETLIILNEDGEPQPKLAERWEISEDQTEYVFHLRENVTFHNGEPLTAADVVFSLESFKDSPNAVRSSPLRAVDTLEAVDESTVKVTLAEPSRAFLREVAGGISGSIFSESAYSDLATQPIGTGPYIFAEYQQDDHVTLERNSEYWGDSGGLERVTIQVIPDSTAAFNAIRAGEADGYPDIGEETLERLSTEGFRDSYTVEVDNPGSSVLYVAFNSRAEPYDDVNVRQALAHAIERQPYVDVFGGSESLVTTCTFATAEAPWFVPEADDDCLFPYDPERASELLAEAGHAGTEVELTSITDIGNLAPPADILRAQLEAAGVNVQDNAMEFARYNEQVFSGNPPNFGVTIMFTARGMDQFNCPDPEDAQWHSFCNADVTELLQEADKAESREGEVELINKAMTVLEEQAVIIPILTSKSVTLLHPEIEGWADPEVFQEVNLASLSWD